MFLLVGYLALVAHSLAMQTEKTEGVQRLTSLPRADQNPADEGEAKVTVRRGVKPPPDSTTRQAAVDAAFVPAAVEEAFVPAAVEAAFVPEVSPDPGTRVQVEPAQLVRIPSAPFEHAVDDEV